MTTFTTTLNQVESMYVGYFGRAGDPAGVNYWVGQLNAKTITLGQLAASFSVQPEATAKYPYLANPNINDPGVFVDQVYLNMFNHVADAAGKAFWVAQLTAAAGNPSAIGAMIQNIIAGAIGTDSTIITNKVDVAADFTVKASNAGTTWNASANAQSSAEIATVTDTAASVTAAKAATDAYIASAPGPQQTFTLGIDTLTASTFNANFNAPLTFNAPTGTLVQSLQPGDSAIDTAPLTGTGLSNGGTFNVTFNSTTVGQVPLVTLKGIPTHTVTNLAGAGVVGGYQGDVTGLVTLNNTNSTGIVTVGTAGNGIDKGGVAGTTTTGATLLSTVNVSGIVGVTAASSTTVIVNTAALAGAADALQINVTGAFGTGTTGAGANTVSVKNDTAAAGATDNAYETLTINAAAATNISLADATSGILSTTRINVTGAGLATLWSQASESHFTKLTTIDASTQTGGVTVTGGTNAGGLLTGAVLTSFKGGTGADSGDITTMTAAQVQAITATNLDGGTGTARDTLILASNAGGTGAANTTVAINNSNFEIIGISTLGGTVDYSKFGAGVDTFTLVGDALTQAAAATFNNMASGLTVNLGILSGGFAETFNAAGTALTDVFNVTSTGTAAGIGAEVFTGFEVINQTMTVAAVPASSAIASILATPSAGANVTFNLVDNNGSGVFFVTGTTNIGAGGTLNISGTGTSSVSLTGAVTAGAINASGLNPGAAATTVGVFMVAAPTGQISILGSNGADVLRGSTVADAISAGSGNDELDGGAGGDVWAGGAGADVFGSLIAADDFANSAAALGVAASASGLTATVAAGQTITFGTGIIGINNVDRVTDFVSGTDKLDVVTGATAPTSIIGANATTTAGNTAGVTFVGYGNYVAATGVFTLAAGWSAATPDAILEVGNGATKMNDTAAWAVLTGLNQALVGADFI
jgi:hypothetical protein